MSKPENWLEKNKSTSQMFSYQVYSNKMKSGTGEQKSSSRYDTFNRTEREDINFRINK